MTHITEWNGSNRNERVLHPDVQATWGAYLDFKHRYPDFPVLVYMRHQAVNTLKSEIFNALGRKRSAA